MPKPGWLGDLPQKEGRHLNDSIYIPLDDHSLHLIVLPHDYVSAQQDGDDAGEKRKELR